MANKKNGKKAPKKAHPFWARLWSGFRYWLQTLWSNGACLLARGKPWWASLPVVILSIIIVIIPTAVAMGNVSASSFITGQDLGLVAPTAAFVRDMEEKGILLSIDKDGILSDENDSWEKAYGANDLGAYYHMVVREVPKLPVETDSSSSQVIVSKPELVEETIVDFAVYADFCLAGKHRGKLVLYGEHSRERLLLPYLCPQQFRTKPCIGESCGKFAML